MSADHAVVGVVGTVIGAGVATIVNLYLLRTPPASLVRLNYRNLSVPAVLGFGVAAGAIAGSLSAWSAEAHIQEFMWAALAAMGALFLGGAADDLRGDERAKGFSGHIRAALQGRLTGGFMKIVAGAVGGLAAGFLLAEGRVAIEIALLVALTANLFNLLDRAPGRALKVAFLVALPLLLLGPASWVLASAGMWGAGAATLPLDLRERGMLGDTGANPVGGMLGLGLGVALDEPARLVALALVLLLNVASEKVSFSAVIERSPLLRSLDRAGRPSVGEKS